MKNLVEEKSPYKVGRTIIVHILKPAEIWVFTRSVELTSASLGAAEVAKE